MIKIKSKDEAERAYIFSNNLRHILQNGPIKTAELASRIGVTQTTISSYSLGRTFPKEERIQEIADALGVTVDDLFDDTYAPWKFGNEE